MVCMQTMRLGCRESPVRIISLAIARRGNEDAHHLIDIVTIYAYEIPHRVGSIAENVFDKPSVIDIYRRDIVELLRVLVDLFRCSLVEAGDG